MKETAILDWLIKPTSTNPNMASHSLIGAAMDHYDNSLNRPTTLEEFLDLLKTPDDLIELAQRSQCPKKDVDNILGSLLREDLLILVKVRIPLTLNILGFTKEANYLKALPDNSPFKAIEAWVKLVHDQVGATGFFQTPLPTTTLLWDLLHWASKAAQHASGDWGLVFRFVAKASTNEETYNKDCADRLRSALSPLLIEGINRALSN